MNKETKKIAIEIQRKDGKTYFRFSVDEKITAMYQAQSVEVRESINWAGLSFYYVPEIVNNSYYKQLLQEYDLTDDFGQGIYQNGKLNIAWIRAVGGQGEIIIGESLPFVELSQMTRKAVQFLKSYFENYIKDCTIKGSLTVEV